VSHFAAIKARKRQGQETERVLIGKHRNSSFCDSCLARNTVELSMLVQFQKRALFGVPFTTCTSTESSVLMRFEKHHHNRRLTIAFITVT
jgi:hypothetical protein